MKHTQGPWEIRATRIDDNAFISDIQAPNQDNPSQSGSNPTVATTWYRPDDGEAEANARLIAAAPDLLEALNELVNWFGMDRSDWDGWEGVNEVLDSASNAIAKATGKEVSP